MNYVQTGLDQLWHRWLKIPYTLYIQGDTKTHNPKATLVFIHGIGGSSNAWDQVISKLTLSNERVLTLDLIGFGHSPKPRWAKYNTKLQAVALRATLSKLSVNDNVILVGHSLGALVAIESACLYPSMIKQLILCSPPLYRPDTSDSLNYERALRKIFGVINHTPEQFIAVSAIARKYKLINQSFDVTADNIDIFVNTLEAAVINQTALEDAAKLRVPMEIVYGVIDPFVLPRNLSTLAKTNKYIHINKIAAGHEMIGTYITPVSKIIQRAIESM